jgi:hypothetical protein
MYRVQCKHIPDPGRGFFKVNIFGFRPWSLWKSTKEISLNTAGNLTGIQIGHFPVLSTDRNHYNDVTDASVIFRMGVYI